jgi:UDP-glucose 4-epimerase
MQMLITGGAGFIGSHLIDRLLLEDHQIVCVDDLSLGTMNNIEHHLDDERFSFIKLDVLDTTALDTVFASRQFDCVIHLAANSDIQKGRESTTIDRDRTFMSTFNVLDAMRKAGVKKIVFASTSAVYGDLNKPLDEDTGPLVPISLYGAAKLASEAYITAFCGSFDMQAWIFRFPNVVGERTTHGIIHDFLNKLARDPTRLEILGNGKQQKPYLYVKELIDGILFCMAHANEQINRFMLGVPDTVTVTRIAQIVIEEMKLDARLEYTGGDRGWVGDVPFFSYRLDKITHLGWHSSRTSEEAIRLATRAEIDYRAANKKR